jgi:hypothetical protein
MSVLSRLRTVLALIAHFATPGRLFLLPLLIILLFAGLLLALSGGLSYVTPFWYAIF